MQTYEATCSYTQPKKMPLDYELLKVASTLVVFNIFLPSFDTYSDIAFSYSLISGTYEPYKAHRLMGKVTKHPIYGSVMLIPIILVTLFTIPHWFRRENSILKRLLTFPILIGQLWPQWQVVKILWLMIKKSSTWKNEKEKLEKEVSSLGN